MKIKSTTKTTGVKRPRKSLDVRLGLKEEQLEKIESRIARLAERKSTVKLEIKVLQKAIAKGK